MIYVYIRVHIFVTRRKEVRSIGLPRPEQSGHLTSLYSEDISYISTGSLQHSPHSHDYLCSRNAWAIATDVDSIPILFELLWLARHQPETNPFWILRDADLNSQRALRDTVRRGHIWDI